MIRNRINLTTTDAVTDWVEVGKNTIAAVQIVGPGTSDWSGGVASLQYSLAIGEDENGNSLESAQLFDPTLTLTSSAPSEVAVAVTNLGYIRLKTTTAQTGAADNLNVIWRLSQ